MVWAKIDDEILDNPKIAKAGIFGFAMHVAGITWCCRNLSDGRIPYARVTALVTCDRVLFDTSNPLALSDGPKSMGGDEGLDPYLIAEHLVDCELWERTEDGYVIHDFLEYNPSREEVLARRVKEAERQEKSRKSRAESRRDKTASSSVTLPHPVPDPLKTSSLTARAKEPEKLERGALPPADPHERYVQPGDKITQELRNTAALANVQDIDAAWMKFCGSRAGKWLHVQGNWQAYCVSWASNEKDARDKRRAQDAPSGPIGEGPRVLADRRAREAAARHAEKNAISMPEETKAALGKFVRGTADPESSTRLRRRGPIESVLTDAEREARKQEQLRELAESDLDEGKAAAT